MPNHYHWCWVHCIGIDNYGINLAITEYSGISTKKVKLGIPPNNSLCGLVTTYGNIDLGQQWLQCLLPDSSTLLSWLILAYHQRCCVAFTWEWFKKVLMELCIIFCQNIVFCSSSVSGCDDGYCHSGYPSLCSIVLSVSPATCSWICLKFSGMKVRTREHNAIPYKLLVFAVWKFWFILR